MELKDSLYEVINFGISGYGLDQAYMRYTIEGIHYHPHRVLIGFMPENIHRIVNVFRPFYMEGTGMPLAKPRFVLEHGALKLIPNPVSDLNGYARMLTRPDSVLPRLSKFDEHFHTRYARGPFDFLASVRTGKILLTRVFNGENIIMADGCYNPESEAFLLLCGLLEKFYLDVQKNGASPLILILPSQSDTERLRKNKVKRYQPLIDVLDKNKYTYLDVMDAFKARASGFSMQELFNGHYTNLSNSIVAQAIIDHFKQYP
jgi:hypothetical protein